MSYRRLPLDMRKRITDYFEHRYQGKFFNEKWILDEMSDKLREVSVTIIIINSIDFDGTILLCRFSFRFRSKNTKCDKDVRNYTCRRLVTNLPLLRDADPNLLTEMTDCLEFEMFQPGKIFIIFCFFFLLFFTSFRIFQLSTTWWRVKSRRGKLS